ncbi:hypothetical protein [Endozoicomonas sp. ONNA1]|uniref:hypothetical protein n=1 Tax=Endozoicomonas sp. ONNA1 TaxID=2828740 RepID=UPI002147908C|nr:hypothetical protein [Endozoicomonas sp. ONNA1]
MVTRDGGINKRCAMELSELGIEIIEIQRTPNNKSITGILLQLRTGRLPIHFKVREVSGGQQR